MRAIFTLLILVFLFAGLHVQSQSRTLASQNYIFANSSSDSTAMQQYFNLKARAMAVKDSVLASRDSLKTK